ncbi:MAG: hypothetical protein QNL04_03765 [SAR324 cluster bacterium]|nr:hypothetical protein [SAR324 cluster bacterium]
MQNQQDQQKQQNQTERHGALSNLEPDLIIGVGFLLILQIILMDILLGP